MNMNKDIICFNHPDRTSVLDEIELINKLKLEKPSNTGNILKLINNSNFKVNTGLTETNILIRKHKNINKF